MVYNLYNNFFAKDKPLRHYTQHLLVAVTGFYLLAMFDINPDWNTFLFFILITYLVDIDGLVSVFIFKKKIKEAGEIVSALKAFKFIESATLGTIHHKKLNRLVLHNVLGLIFLVGLFLWSLLVGERMLVVSTWAILCHFTFDIVDDIYQLGHIKNWLWPLNFFPKSH